MSNIKNAGKNFLRKCFEVIQGLGINILPHHFYSETPNIKELRKETYWRCAQSMHSINGNNVDEQLEFVKDCCDENFKPTLSKGTIHQDACKENGEPGYGQTEAEFLHCFIRSRQPKKVIQVGCGVSTAVILQAAKEVNHTIEVVCVDPYPTPYLKKLNNDSSIKLVIEKAQKVSLETLTNLKENDLLFIDSTHTVKPGSEVNRLILEVLPRLPKNCWVHFHDIYFPYTYNRNILDDALFFWTETTLLYAFLLNNPSYTIKASLSMLHYEKTNDLKDIFPNYDPQLNNDGLRIKGQGKHYPSSLYLQVL